MIDDPAIFTGIVLSGAHGIFDVHTDEGILRCTLRGKLKKAFTHAQSEHSVGKTRARSGKALVSSRRGGRSAQQEESSTTPAPTRLSVGDYVKLRRLDASTGLIEEILPRQSSLSRLDSGSTSKKAMEQTLLANLNQVVIVLAVAQPEPHFGFLDRYLVICESANLHAIVCLNKADLEHESYVEAASELYQRLGYTVLWTSARTEQGIDQLRNLLTDHTTLFTGPSGVGKSSLVNVIEPGMAIRTGLVSTATGKGRHTTTGSQLYPLSGGGWLADSAGIRALAAWNISQEELASCFVEFRPYLGECVFSGCTHIEEEGCAIIQALNDDLVDPGRYRSYVRMYMGEER